MQKEERCRLGEGGPQVHLGAPAALAFYDADSKGTVCGECGGKGGRPIGRAPVGEDQLEADLALLCQLVEELPDAGCFVIDRYDDRELWALLKGQGHPPFPPGWGDPA